MLRQAPLNYLVTLALGGVLWLATALIIGGYLSENVSLAAMSIPEFLTNYRIALGVAAVLGIVTAFFWYGYGSRDAVSSRLARARTTWVYCLLGQLFLAIGIVFTLAMLFLTEGLTALDYTIMFAALSMQTYLFFWIATLLMSPRAVEYIPWGKR
jgi:hypothetical protein